MNVSDLVKHNVPEFEQQENLLLDTGTTAFMFAATALVQFMTPGLGFFYAGMVGARSTVQLLFQSFICCGAIIILWNICGFSFTFGDTWLKWNGYALLGNPATYFLLERVEIGRPLQRASTSIGEGFPGMLFVAYQGMFAVISPALLSGAVVDRVRFPVFVALTSIWLLLVYAPVGFWNWGGGWMFQLGAWDFAGGMVVHESAGFSALGLLAAVGNRAPTPQGGLPESIPHNVPFVMLGTAMLWFGWFGFNCGSALSSGRLMAVAFINTMNAPAAAMVCWVAIDRLVKGKPSLVGACSAVVAGLVAITPAAGFVQPQMGLLVGVLAALVCYPCVILVREKMALDDTCDAVGVHGAAGFLGTLLVGALADDDTCLDPMTATEWCVNPGTVARSWSQFKVQTLCAVFTAVYSCTMSYLIMKAIFFFTPKLSTYEMQLLALDRPSFGEEAYRHFGEPAPVYHELNQHHDAKQNGDHKPNGNHNYALPSARLIAMHEGETTPTTMADGSP